MHFGFSAILEYEKDGQQYREIYGHLDKPDNAAELLEQGSVRVSKGDQVGTMGNTGNCWTKGPENHALAPVTDAERDDGWGTHLHWEQQINNNGAWTKVDPMELENAL